MRKPINRINKIEFYVYFTAIMPSNKQTAPKNMIQ